MYYKLSKSREKLTSRVFRTRRSQSYPQIRRVQSDLSFKLLPHNSDNTHSHEDIIAPRVETCCTRTNTTWTTHLRARVNQLAEGNAAHERRQHSTRSPRPIHRQHDTTAKTSQKCRGGLSERDDVSLARENANLPPAHRANARAQQAQRASDN